MLWTINSRPLITKEETHQGHVHCVLLKMLPWVHNVTICPLMLSSLFIRRDQTGVWDWEGLILQGLVVAILPISAIFFSNWDFVIFESDLTQPRPLTLTSFRQLPFLLWIKEAGWGLYGIWLDEIIVGCWAVLFLERGNEMIGQLISLTACLLIFLGDTVNISMAGVGMRHSSAICFREVADAPLICTVELLLIFFLFKRGNAKEFIIKCLHVDLNHLFTGFAELCSFSLSHWAKKSDKVALVAQSYQKLGWCATVEHSSVVIKWQSAPLVSIVGVLLH